MKITIERVTAKGVEVGPNSEAPYRMITRNEGDDEAIQADIEERVIDEIRRRLVALTDGAASKLEITIQLIDED